MEDELDGGALPPGEWWVVDPTEGNVNHLHALPEWAVTATLVRDTQAVLTAVHLPMTGDGGYEWSAAQIAAPLRRATRPRASPQVRHPPADQHVHA